MYEADIPKDNWYTDPWNYETCSYAINFIKNTGCDLEIISNRKDLLEIKKLMLPDDRATDQYCYDIFTNEDSGWISIEETSSCIDIGADFIDEYYMNNSGWIQIFLDRKSY